MSKRRPVLQLDDIQPPHGSPSSRQYDSFIPTPDSDENDDDAAGDMPTPERLVTQDMLPPKSELDNKVANFLAEIDALDNEEEEDGSPVPMTSADREEEETVARFQASPAREGFTAPVSRDTTPPPPASRSTANAYSNMFVKGTPEFTKKPDEKRNDRDRKTELEPWPEEPKTDWQQLIDESTKYPYYWNVSTNEVVWDIPAEFSAYLLRQKEYEEKVERGLREGKLDPSGREKKSNPPVETKEGNTGKETSSKTEERSKESTRSEKSSRSSESQRRRYASDSEDSSSDSSDSDVEHPRARRTDNSIEVPSSSTSLLDKDNSRDSYKKKDKNSEGPAHVLPDSTEAVSKHEKKSRRKSSSSNEDAADFDIDDIDKELELALERKKKEPPKAEDKKKGDDDKGKTKDKDRRKDYKHRSDDRREERGRHEEERRKHKHKDHDRDRDRDRKHRSREEKEEKPKLTLKERLRIEMELKLEKERRKKKAIEEMMTRELEKTVAGSRSQKRHRDDRDEPRKRERYSRDEEESRSRDQFTDVPLRRGYDAWDRDRRAPSYEDRLGGAPFYKPPPPTEEMVAYKERSGSEVMDYAHGSGRHKGLDGDDGDDMRPADQREIEMKKLEALQLAELALSKLEFLEVTKKGLSKLQILLIELETRHQDWQAGGLTTNHFLEKLRGANWQLEQYEGSAAPTNWVCSWDRDYRRYFYTHKHTGKTQWDYPDTEDIKAEEEKMKKKAVQKRTDPEPEISSSSDRVQTFTGMETDLPSDILANVALPPPPPPPAEEHPSVKSLMLMYGSTSESEGEEPETARAKKKQKTDPDPPPPLPPLPTEAPPMHDIEERKDKHERHKKKKKKEKSKKKEKNENAVVTTVGPMLPAAPVPIVASSVAPTAVYPGEEMAYPNNQPPPPGETFYPQPMVAGTEVPVYGTASVSEMYGQNDQPLEFGMAPESMDITAGGEPGQVVIGITQTPQVMHPPELYAASSTVGQYPSPGEYAEAQEGSAVSETPATLVQNPEEKKKKKKSEKMGSANISLKKKHVSSMVQKWQKVKKEVELEERDRAIREAEIRKKLAELE